MKNIFLEIANNIKEKEYIQKFIDLEEEWTNLDKEFQKECIRIIREQKDIDDSFYDVMFFMEDYDKASLVNTISVEKAVQIAKNIFDERAKVFAALYLVNRLDNMDDFFDIIDGIDMSEYSRYIAMNLYNKNEDKIDNILRLIELLPEEYPYMLDGDDISFMLTREEALSNLAGSLHNMKKSLEILENVKDEYCRNEAMLNIYINNGYIQKAKDLLDEIYEDKEDMVYLKHLEEILNAEKKLKKTIKDKLSKT